MCRNKAKQCFSQRRHWLKLDLFSLIHWLDVNSSRDLSAVHTNTSDEYVCFLLFSREGKKFGAFSFVCVCVCLCFFPFSTRKAENLIVALPARVQ